MSNNKNSRHTPSPSSPIPSNNSSKLPKFLQKSATRDRSKSVNDSLYNAAESSSNTPSDDSSQVLATPASSSKGPRKSSRFLVGKKDKSPPVEEDRTLGDPEEPAIIVEAPSTPSVPIPRSRTRPDRPTSGSENAISQSSPSYTHSHTSTSPRMSDLPTRLSGWFSHTFSSSSTDLSLPSLLNPHMHNTSGSSSPNSKGKMVGASALMTVAKHGKGHLDKAMRYLLDSDATPDKCLDPIWLLGVQHKGYEPPPPTPPPLQGEAPGGRTSIDSKSKSHGSPPSSFRSTSTKHSHKHSPSQSSLSQSQPPSSRSASPSQSAALSSSLSSSISSAPTATPANPNQKHPGANWPPEFYSDFTSKVWLTYRSQFTPIRDTNLADLPLPAIFCCDSPASNVSYVDTFKSDSSYSVRSISSSNIVPTSPSSSGKKWGWGIPGLGGEKERGWTSDSGWGCMLRTGQSLLANALVFMWLGRDWRRPPSPIPTESYAKYVQIVTWFLDTPSPEAPFSVHRMALAGKELGKDVGQWFGPSTAAGAIKTLVHAFPQCGMGVSVATDGMLFQTDVFAVSHSSTTAPAGSGGSSFAASSIGRRRHNPTTKSWGDRPVLLLLGIRLGLDGVNPIYYDTIRILYTFPQSVGIAGGRPSSSYYFVGSQADNLFYLDPHHARPTVPLRTPPTAEGRGSGFSTTANRTPEADYARERDRSRDRNTRQKGESKEDKKGSRSSPGTVSSPRGSAMKRVVTPTSPSSVRTTGSSTFSYHAPTSPSPLQKAYSSSTSASASSSGQEGSRVPSSEDITHSVSPSRTESPVLITPSSSIDASNTSEMDVSELMGGGDRPHSSGLDPIQEHYISAYSPTELKTFHCERVRKMPLSGLDPSMLIGFLCKNEADWNDFRRRVGELPRTIFSIQDEPPTWPSDSDDNMGLESISDPEDIADSMDLDDDDEDQLRDEVEDDEASEQFFDTRSTSASVSSRSQHSSNRVGSERGRSEEVDTEEDPVDPITPGPITTKFDVNAKGVEDDALHREPSQESDDIEDDWVDPSLSSPMLTPQPTQQSQMQHQQGTDSLVVVPPLAKSKSSGSTGSGSTKKKKKKHHDQQPVPVPKIKVPSPPSKESFPFPVGDNGSAGWSGPSSSSGDVDAGKEQREKRMHTARARDGGRTQSGGIKGILTDEWNESERDKSR
ncbi:Cysteine protease atg4 [Paramarasmius palmivorus]|uniref:Autophagy-related protein 4 n=1 Tax=Paramarasmius palmivorus TaxID=297713 RepID=A0AAW0DBL3_9AGAR